MAIDASIPLQAQGINVAKMLDEGSQIGQLWQQQRLNKELDRIYNESQGDVNKMLSLGQQSQMARYIVPQLQAQQAASQKNLLDQQKTLAEIANTNAQALERNANAGNTTFDTSQKKYGAIQGAFQQAAMTGDKGTVLLALDALQRTGAITPEDYAHNFKIISVMNPDEIKQYATGSGLLNKDLAPYLSQTKNNEADNATSVANNVRTTNATLTGQRIAAETADKNRIQDKILAEQRIALERGEFETMIGTDGKAYAVYRNGQVEPLLLKSGEAFTPQPKGNSGQPKLSDKALQLVNDLNVQLSTASQNSSKINGLINDVQSGRLNLSAANQLGAKARNAIGFSDENSRGVENFQTALNQAVNDVLMMAKGTQTEGDANRAAQVIAANPPRDNAAALQALQRLAAVQNNTIAVLNQNINGIYDNYGLSRSQGAPKQTAQAGANQAKLNNILFGK